MYESNFAAFLKPSESLYGFSDLRKSLKELASVSNQSINPGTKELPFNIEAVTRLIGANVHHSTCIGAKVNATIGLGMADDATEETLDELCEEAWLPTITAVDTDFESSGNGYLEVVRDDSDTIVGLHHIPSRNVLIEVDNAQTKDYHFRVTGDSAEGKFARFGDRDRLLGILQLPRNSVSEVIHLKQTTTLNKWYGIPDWIAAVPGIELVMSILQHNYDFFNNRGVPEFFLFLLGKKLEEPEWAEVVKKLSAHVGLGKGFKSGAFNFGHPDIRVQIEKLGLGQESEGQFESMLDALALYIVSAHKVPPLLAGIALPGKIGAANELPNALAAFQALVISQRQKYIGTMLGCSLGKPGVGIKGLNRKSFSWNKVTDEMDLGMLDAVARTRRPIAAPEAPSGTGPQGGKRPPEAGTPAARLASLRAELGPRHGRLMAALEAFEEITLAILETDS